MVIAFKRKNFVLLVTASVLLGMIAGGYFYYLIDARSDAMYSHDKAFAYWGTGIEYRNDGKLDEAVACFNRSLGLRDSYEPTVDLARLYANKGQYEVAIEYYQASLRLLEKREFLILSDLMAKHEKRRILNAIKLLKNKQELTDSN